MYTHKHIKSCAHATNSAERNSAWGLFLATLWTASPTMFLWNVGFSLWIMTMHNYAMPIIQDAIRETLRSISGAINVSDVILDMKNTMTIWERRSTNTWMWTYSEQKQVCIQLSNTCILWTCLLQRMTFCRTKEGASCSGHGHSYESNASQMSCSDVKLMCDVYTRIRIYDTNSQKAYQERNTLGMYKWRFIQHFMPYANIDPVYKY